MTDVEFLKNNMGALDKLKRKNVKSFEIYKEHIIVPPKRRGELYTLYSDLELGGRNDSIWRISAHVRSKKRAKIYIEERLKIKGEGYEGEAKFWHRINQRYKEEGA